MSYQFGMATMVLGSQNIGCLQNLTLDFNYEVAELFCGSGLYPVDVRTHTGRITGSAEFADINAATIAKMIGGEITTDTIDLDNDDYPSTFALVISLTTDSVDFTITFPSVRSSKFSLAFQRDAHVIPNFDFQVQADSNGNIATIDCGDVS